MDPSRILGCLLCLLVLIYSPVHSKVISCGGFVRSFNADVLSKIKIKLESSEGLLKFETDVTPSNGYYMVPVYNKGSYAIAIEGPEGFVFEPARIPITIDGQTDKCTKGEDINFELFGFTVSGKVRSGELAGPSRLNLALYTEDKKEYATTFTDESGNYRFKASPGKYVVSTVDSTQQCVDRGSVAVEVKDKPVTVTADIRISGHSLVVSAHHDSNPLNGATVLLVSDQKIPFDQQIHTPKPSATQKDSKWEYRLLTHEEGKAVFRCLPPNKYQVSVSWATKKTGLVFSPSTQTITIASENVDAKFVAHGFDVVGQVQSNQKPLVGATIFVDGKQVAVSDESGAYKIKALKSGRHAIEAKKEHFYFEKLSPDVTIENPTIPTILVTKLEVCGIVKFDNPENHHGQETQISVLRQDGSLVETLHIDRNGRFCTFLPLGSYTIKPAHESQVKPDFIEIELKDEPVVDLVFTEFKATVNGQLTCFQQSECFGAKASLLSNGREIDLVSVQNNIFVFNEVLPGTYKIQLTGLNSVCLDDEIKSINVESNNLDVVFKQIGYRTQIQSPIDLKLNWKHGSDTGSQPLTSGQNSFCLPKSGTYTFNFDNCHEFVQGKSLSHSLPTTEDLHLTVKSAYFSASIQADTSASPSDFKIQLKSKHGERNLAVVQSSQAKNITFNTFVENDLVGQELELIPKSEKFLFVPTSHKWTFNGECAFNKISFKAKEGKFVTGSIEPAVANVVVQAKHRTDGSLLTSTTDSKGKFKIGLVFNPDDYEVELELEGYKFVSTGANNQFKSIKLSKLIVYYADKATKKELPDVLISLSGGDNYRENKIVNPSGQITFVGLPAGEYFVRSVLREYQFEPATSSVKINEGETIELRLYGHRYAYSAFGKVSTAGGGSPSNQMNVEAISQNCGNLQEDDLTAEDGRFRVRGLKPKCTYRLSLRFTDGTQISSIPPYIDIETEERDTTDLEFTILATIPLNEIVGMVQFVDVPKPKSVRIELYENGVYKAYEEVTTGSVFIFSNVITPSNTYRLSISEADLRSLSVVFKPVEFIATQPTKNVILQVNKREDRPEIETSTSNIFGVIFVLFTAFVCFNAGYSKDVLLSFVDQFRSIALNRESSPGAQSKRQKQKKN